MACGPVLLAERSGTVCGCRYWVMVLGDDSGCCQCVLVGFSFLRFCELGGSVGWRVSCNCLGLWRVMLVDGAFAQCSSPSKTLSTIWKQ